MIDKNTKAPGGGANGSAISDSLTDYFANNNPFDASGGLAPLAYSATVSVISSAAPAILSKKYALVNGELSKSISASMTAGTVAPQHITSLSGLSILLQSLQPNQALCFGASGSVDKKIVTKKEWLAAGKPDNPIPRSTEVFSWPAGGGVMLLDYDPAPDAVTLGRDELVTAIRGAVPGLADAEMLWWPSSSSHIYSGETDLTGLRGQRLYPLVLDAADIPRAGAALVEYLWAAGHGYVLLSSSGQMLERCLIDASVWQTNRLDFAAGAVCSPPIEQRRGAPVIIQGAAHVVDTRLAIPEPDDDTRARANLERAKAKAAVKGEANQVRTGWVAERSAAIVERMGGQTTDETLALAENTALRAVESGVLAGDYIVTVLDGGRRADVTIGEIMDDPARYHGALTLDPLEPEYGGHKIVGKIYLYSARPRIYSFAHGGKNFKLLRQPQAIELAQGQTHDAVNRSLELLRAAPEVFDFAGELVIADDGHTCPLDEHHLRHWLGGAAQFWAWRTKRDGSVDKALKDPPAAVCTAVLSLGTRRGLKPLDAIVTAPTLRADGSVLSVPGYDAVTRLLVDMSDAVHVPTMPGEAEVIAAVETLLRPFAEFPVTDSLGRGILLASLLTAVVRPTLPTAPAFGFDAPVQGSGKTLMASCVAALATGEIIGVLPHTASRDDEEVRKRLFAVLRAGHRCVIWDNVVGVFTSAALASALSSPVYTDRVLGKTEVPHAPNRALFVLTGNNLTLAGDLPRRVLTCRIDPQIERPYARRFDLDPLAYVITHRVDMVVAALTIIRGWLCAHARGAQPAEGRMASFELWDDLVRQPVAWLGRLMPGRFDDPMGAIADAQASDPEQQALIELMDAIESHFGREYVTSSEILRAMQAFFGAGENLLADAFANVTGTHAAAMSCKSVGRVLAYRAGRVVRGKRIVKKCSDGTMKWKVQQV